VTSDFTAEVEVWPGALEDTDGNEIRREKAEKHYTLHSNRLYTVEEAETL